MKARDNPFRTDRILEVRYRPQAMGWAGIMARLSELSYRAAIVGPEGSGKTTLLEDLAPRLEALGLRTRPLRLTFSTPRFMPGFLNEFFADRTASDVILLDGADAMSALRWRRFRRRWGAVGGLIITSRRPGMLPTLLECRTTPELLAGIVRDVLRMDDRATFDEVEAVAGLSCELFDRYDGNLRLALRELYDRYGASMG